MSTLTDKLKAPFPADKVHWRVGATSKDKSKGIALAYINARDVMQRLDEAVGPESWQCRYPFAGCCELSIKCGDEWVTKTNGAGATDVEGEKGQYSDAFKRAAVLWGVAQYLYDLPNEWVPLEPAGRSYKIAGTPKLPAWALPPQLTREEAIEQLTSAKTLDELKNVFMGLSASLKKDTEVIQIKDSRKEALTQTK